MYAESRLRLLPALGLLALGACSVPLPVLDPAVAIAVPATWAQAPSPLVDVEDAQVSHASTLTQWWLRFDDPLLSELVRSALLANPDVLGAQAALQEAWALRDLAAAGLQPRLGGSASVQRSRANGNDTHNIRAGLDASWDPDIFGVNRSALQASQASAMASGATLGAVQVSTAAAVALAYITLRGNQARLAIAAENLSSQQETLQLTQWRVQAGLLSTLEGEQARAAAEQTRAQQPALQAAIEQGAHALAVLSGQPPATLRPQLLLAATLPQPSEALTVALPARMLRQRADVGAAEYRIRAALARLAGAEAAGLPNFRLSGDLALSALTLGALGNGAALAANLLAGLSLPLFDGGATRAQSRAQHAALEQASVAYQATVLKALKEVEDALVALRGNRERLGYLRAAAQAADQAALLARQRYSSGLVDFQIVLETQRSQRAAQEAVVAAATDVSADHVRLYIALGGGWDGEPGNRTALATR